MKAQTTTTSKTRGSKPASAVPASRAVRSRKSGTSSAKPQDAIQLLKADHKKVKKMFAEFEKLTKSKSASVDDKIMLVEAICMELKVHTTIEEEIFYPAVRMAIKQVDLVNEADVEHASAKDLISQLEASTPDDMHYDARVIVLGEYIEHHVQEEEQEMFPKVQRSKLDTMALGSEMQQRRQLLMPTH